MCALSLRASPKEEANSRGATIYLVPVHEETERFLFILDSALLISSLYRPT